MRFRTPSYRLHKPSGQAVVTLNGRDIYLGRYGTAASRAEYDRLVAEWLAGGRQPAPPAAGAGPADLSINELLVAYVRFADDYYRKDGEPTSEPSNIRLALRPLKQLYGRTSAREFGPLALKTIRRSLIEADLCRTEINKRIRHIVRLFKWAVEHELVPPAVHQALKAVAGLRKGRSEARESRPVQPVPEAFVEAVRPYMARQVWTMVQLQRLTGMRPGEVCQMRTCDLDTSGRVWVYTPARHKTEHHGKRRAIYLGPRAQAVLQPWLKPELAAYIFSPREATEERLAARRRARKTPLTPSQRARTRKRAPRRAPGECYEVSAYGHAITAACDRAFPHPTLASIPWSRLTPEQQAELRAWRREHRWHPHQLRHSAATWLRKEFGLDVARVILGHSSPAVTEVYAELDRDKAIAAMERVG